MSFLFFCWNIMFTKQQEEQRPPGSPPPWENTGVSAGELWVLGEAFLFPVGDPCQFLLFGFCKTQANAVLQLLFT